MSVHHNRPKLSEEEIKKKAAAARERRHALLADVKSMTADQKAAALRLLSVVNTDGHNLSGKNCLMVASQAFAAGLPVPTVVGGFKQWRGRGRVVARGQHGLTICWPKTSKDEEGNESIDGYGWGIVFDISQTVPAGSEEVINMAEKYEEWAATWAEIAANDLPLFQNARRREVETETETEEKREEEREEVKREEVKETAAAADSSPAPVAPVVPVASPAPAPSVLSGGVDDPAAALLAAFAAA